MRKSYTYKELVDALRFLGIKKGDLVHVHSQLFALGLMDGVDPSRIPNCVLNALLEILGSEGTLTVPAAVEDYARFGTPYDCRRSPVDKSQGILGQIVVAQPESFRTYCPMCAVAGIGPKAREICHQKTGSAFGTLSAWEKLYEMDAKQLFLGIRPHRAFTYVYFIQFRFGVPHLYNKLYTVPIYEDGKPIDLPITCCVRYLNPHYKIMENCEPFEAHLDSLGLIRKVPIGRGYAYLLMSSRRIFEEGTKKLMENLYYFLKQPPEFIEGMIPMDGNTGPFIPDKLRFSTDS